MTYHRFANGIVLSHAAFLAGGLDKRIARINREREQAEQQHAEQLRANRCARRAERRAAVDFSQFA